MAHKIQSYLRTHRKRSGLTQDELAFLLGCCSGAKVSRHERLSRRPNLIAAFGCQVVFGVPAHELFPGIYAEVEQAITERAHVLAQKLDRGPDGPIVRQKRLAIDAILRQSMAAPAEPYEPPTSAR